MKQLGARGTMLVCCASFFSLGMITAALGPALPELAANTGADLAMVGAVITALFIGSLVALSAAGPLNDRFGQRPVMMVGVVLLALGALGIALSPWLPLVLLSGVVAGLGHGAIDVGTNVLIAEIFAKRSAAALNLVNVFFGLGAMAGPLLAGLTLQLWATALPVLWLGALLILAQVLLIPAILTIPRAPTEAGGRPGAALGALLRSPYLWLLSMLALVYVGIENGTSNWTPTYLQRTTNIDLAAAAYATSGFWMALTAGRVVGTLLGTRLALSTQMLITVAGTLLGGIWLVCSLGAIGMTTMAVLLLGFFFGPIFPLIVALTTARFREAPGTAASIVIGLGSLGGMLLPWLQGILLQYVSPLASVMLIAAGTLALLGLHIGYGLLERAPATNSLLPAVPSQQRKP